MHEGKLTMNGFYQGGPSKVCHISPFPISAFVQGTIPACSSMSLIHVFHWLWHNIPWISGRLYTATANTHLLQCSEPVHSTDVSPWMSEILTLIHLVDCFVILTCMSLPVPCSLLPNPTVNFPALPYQQQKWDVPPCDKISVPYIS